MNKEVESELKLIFEADKLPAVEAALAAPAASPEAKSDRLVSRYFDTADDYLWRHGATLRVRDGNGEKIQTLKRETASALDRQEFETPTQQDWPDLDAVDDTPLASLFKKTKVRERLQKKIDVDVVRRASTIAADGAQIETALDTGEIVSGEHKTHVDEVELELKQGDKSALFEMARRLCNSAPITLSPISKAERGHLLAKGEWGRALKGRAPDIRKTFTSSEAFELICRSCLHDLAVNLAALDGEDSTEAVHQGRVSLRRLRAALSLFRPVAKDELHQHLDDELKWISHVFGEARDLDVFQKSLEPSDAARAIPGARQLAERTGAGRDRAHEAVKRAVRSRRFRILLVDLAAWLEEGNWRRRSKKVNEPIGDYARRALKKRLRKFLKKARGLVDLGPDEQHKIRIKAKKLRYMAGFFASSGNLVAKPKQLQGLLRRLERMQDCLGLRHDEQAMAEFLADEAKGLPDCSDPMIPYAAGRLTPALDGPDQKLARADAAYRKLARTSAF
jgi:triphosphatase